MLTFYLNPVAYIYRSLSVFLILPYISFSFCYVLSSVYPSVLITSPVIDMSPKKLLTGQSSSLQMRSGQQNVEESGIEHSDNISSNAPTRSTSTSASDTSATPLECGDNVTFNTSIVKCGQEMFKFHEFTSSMILEAFANSSSHLNGISNLCKKQLRIQLHFSY